MNASPLIEIRDLRIRFHGDDGRITHAVDSVDLSVANGATLGLVGESGCGKSVTSLAIMGLLPKQSAEISGAIRFDGFDLLQAPDQILRDLRGNRLAMIFQEPMTSLNPSFTIGDQIIETILRHRGGSRRSARDRTIELLRRVHIPSPERRIDEYPHKLSGGMRQRVMIAMALACDPRLLIADEPTTALDVTLQAQILELMRELKAASGAAIILITHDLGRRRRSLRRSRRHVCRRDRRTRAGRRIVLGAAASLHRRPARLDPAAGPSRRTACHDRGHGPEHDAPPRGLSFRRALPFRAGRLHQGTAAARRSEPRPPLALYPRAARTPGVLMALLEVEGLVKHFVAERSLFGRALAHVKAVDGVSFSLEAGKTLALVGESGCGKSTVSRLVLRLIEPDAGTIRFEGRDLLSLDAGALRAFRREAQIIFQDPYASLNPRMTVGQILTEPLALHDLVPAAQRRERVEEILRLVGLEPRLARRYPHEFSGGQRQRIAIARALAVEPKLIICDEPVSALDVSIRSQILNLLRELQDRLGLAYIFVSHDLAVVKHIADHVAVMNLGQIVETAAADALFAAPRHPYSRALLSAIPVPKPRAKRSRIVLQGEIPSALNPPPGCRFHTRCPYVVERCRSEMPQLLPDGIGHATACHRTSELPSSEAIVPSNGGFSPVLEKLVAAFSGGPEAARAGGVSSLRTDPA
ncbi:oligopeptide/dipeptide ABC transporter ATP-binding protein [Bradyrhizobium sp. LM6.11]